MTRRGIDTAHWQHPGDRPIDWPRVKNAGVDWAAIKLTDGRHGVDPWARRDVEGAKAAGLEVLGYHYARPARGDAVAQARHFLDIVYLFGGLDGAVVDLEEGRGMGWRELGEWLSTYLGAGAAQLVYWNLDYRAHVGPHTTMRGAGEWVAAPSMVRAPAGAMVWQRGQAAIPGIAAAVDLDDVLYPRGGLHR